MDEVMQLTLPKGTEKLDDQQLKNLSHIGIDEKTAPYFHNHIYKKDNLLIYYLYSSSFPAHPERRHSLESNQKMMVALLSGHSELKGKIYIVDTSKIITVNDIRFLIIGYHDDEKMCIRFTSDYGKNGEFINGFIEFKKPGEEEAKQYLRDLLQSMHFKN